MTSRTAVLFIITAAIVVTAKMPSVAAEAGWVQIDSNSESSFFYDPKDLSRPAQKIVRVKARVVYTEKGSREALEIFGADKGYAGLAESRYSYDIDCARKRSKLVDVTHLDSGGGTLKKVDMEKVTEWEAMAPDARLEVVSRQVCTE